ncbi:MAG: hypothetical protein ABJE66_25190 [Deltaproteobacteria bacterium]
MRAPKPHSGIEPLDEAQRAAANLERILVTDDRAQIIVANPVAREITSRLPGDSLAVEHDKTLVTRFFEPDGETPFDIEKLPLRKAIQGHRVRQQ